MMNIQILDMKNYIIRQIRYSDQRDPVYVRPPREDCRANFLNNYIN